MYYVIMFAYFFALQAGQDQVRQIGNFLWSWGLLIWAIVVAIALLAGGVMIWRRPEGVGTWEYVSDKAQTAAGSAILVVLGAGLLVTIVFGIFGRTAPVGPS